jgi:hypothetical protein
MSLRTETTFERLTILEVHATCCGSDDDRDNGVRLSGEVVSIWAGFGWASVLEVRSGNELEI